MEPEIADKISKIEKTLSRLEDFIWSDTQVLMYAQNQLKVVARMVSDLKSELEKEAL